MRILIVHNTLWAHYKSVLFHHLAEAAKQAGADLYVIQIALTEKHRTGLGDPDLVLTDYPHEVLFNTSLEETTLFRRCWSLLKRGWAYNPDVVTITGYYDPAQVLLALSLKLRGCRIVVQNESTSVDQTRRSWRERLKTGFLRTCDGFFCFGTKAADYLIRLGVRPDRILIRNNAVVDNQRLQEVYAGAFPTRTIRQREQQLKPHNFIYVGRFIEIKNLRLLLQVFASVKRQPAAADWGLLLLGEGDQKQALQQRVQQLDLTGTVHFIDGQPWYKVPEYLALADVLVLPSRSEPWGLVVNEAMACGMPVIVSERCGCAADLVRHGQNGFVFDADDPAGLARYLEAFINQQVPVADMGAVSRQLIAPYAPDTVARESVRHYKKLIGS